ncbi:hypothetical protein D3C78_1787260 [compost metagenome]
MTLQETQTLLVIIDGHRIRIEVLYLWSGIGVALGLELIAQAADLHDLEHITRLQGLFFLFFFDNVGHYSIPNF